MKERKIYIKDGTTDKWEPYRFVQIFSGPYGDTWQRICRPYKIISVEDDFYNEGRTKPVEYGIPLKGVSPHKLIGDHFF